MAPTKQELSLLINPLVPEAVQHNNRVRLTNTNAIDQSTLQPQLTPYPPPLYTLQIPLLLESLKYLTTKPTYRSFHPSTP